MYPHSTFQQMVQQYRERSPNPYVGVKEEGEFGKELYGNDPISMDGNLGV